ncbi:hypothetical protein ON010_g4505 [Phytophthora cinnamomi]|nr:hypothetical protein ON010_g4505 [Phytophthora cinnamomi]
MAHLAVRVRHLVIVDPEEHVQVVRDRIRQQLSDDDPVDDPPHDQRQLHQDIQAQHDNGEVERSVRHRRLGVRAVCRTPQPSANSRH